MSIRPPPLSDLSIIVVKTTLEDVTTDPELTPCLMSVKILRRPGHLFLR